MTTFEELLQDPEVLLLHDSFTIPAVLLRETLCLHVKKAEEVLKNGSADLHDGICNIKGLKKPLSDVKRVSALISQVAAKIVQAKGGMGA